MRLLPSEGDGTRTRNHRIDSPLTPCRKDESSNEVTATPENTLAHSLARETQIDADLARVLDKLPQTVQVPARQMWIDHDADADVLYLRFQKPQRATDSEMRDDGIIIHRRGKQIVGLTELEASR